MHGAPFEEPVKVGAGGSGVDETTRAAWQMVLIDGHERLRRAQRVFRYVPSAPRCKLCHNPFGGVGGRLLGLAGFKPSRKNPNLCDRCCDTLPPGGLEVDTAVVFVDVRGSTALAEKIGARAFADLLNRFYQVATDVLIRHDAIIDKLIGDEVMAFFVPGIAGTGYRRQAALAAIELVTIVSREGVLPVGAAVNAGTTYVGNVGADRVVDFTAIGDPVNTAARIQELASAGEVLLTEDLYPPVSEQFPNAGHRTLAIRGRADPVGVYAVRVPA
jgi:adenylate cyclase